MNASHTGRKFGNRRQLRKMKKPTDIVLYRSRDGAVQLDVQLERETIWLSLNQLAELFARDKSVVSRHLRNVFKEGELHRASVVA